MDHKAGETNDEAGNGAYHCRAGCTQIEYILLCRECVQAVGVNKFATDWFSLFHDSHRYNSLSAGQSTSTNRFCVNVGAGSNGITGVAAIWVRHCWE